VTSPSDRLDHGGVHFHRHRTLQHLDRQQEFTPILLAEQEPFQSLQRTHGNPDPITTLKVGVRLYGGRTLHHPANRIDLRIGYAGRLSPAPHHGVDAGSAEDGEPLFKGAAQEDVTWEEGERNPLNTVLPLMGGCIERQEGFKPFPRQGLLDTLFVLMAGVKSIPGIVSVEFRHVHLLLIEPQTASLPEPRGPTDICMIPSCPLNLQVPCEALSGASIRLIKTGAPHSKPRSGVVMATPATRAFGCAGPWVNAYDYRHHRGSAKSRRRQTDLSPKSIGPRPGTSQDAFGSEFPMV